METISFDDFLKVELRVGRVLSAEPFAQARKPAYVLQVDFGPELGVRKSSAQVTVHYRPEDPRSADWWSPWSTSPTNRSARSMSECLVTGFHDADGAVALCVPDRDVPLGARLL